ncbi:hypothetical protein K9M47_03725 [Candidatus Gracilibacteria bacterium]|nr:hypothetical protein [Candidatus Gracilibacteria bacterium]MCF7898522.1 hypothetical protein [Candidatus Paceibacterota bacterium]
MPTPTPYIPLEGDFVTSVGGTVPKFDGASPSLFTSTSFLYTLFFVIIVVVASTKYAQAGLFRMEASQHGITKSNEIFKKTTLGLVGVFSLWLILFTFNKDLLNGEVGLDALRSKGGEFGGGGATGNTSRPNTNPDEISTRKIFTDIGITFNKPACRTLSETSCTNVGGIRQETINTLTKLKNECKCSIEITGGTEPGHSTNSNHGVGKEAVDISLTQDVLSFLKTNGVNVGDDTRCNTKYKYDSLIFWDENVGCDRSGNPNSARHFHASFTGR